MKEHVSKTKDYIDLKIPQVIYYCWFGGRPLPHHLKRYMQSWKKYMPEYRIIEINEKNYDVGKNAYICEAYKQKKYAFVSDYARLDVLYQNGGVYLDTDVELIKSLQPVIDRGPYMGIECSYVPECMPRVNVGLGMAARPQMPVMKRLLDIYDHLEFHFAEENVKTVVDYVTDVLADNGLKIQDGIQSVAGFLIYPRDYFNPINYLRNSETFFSENTYSVHHFEASWVSAKARRKRMLAETLQKMLGADRYQKMLNRIHGR